MTKEIKYFILTGEPGVGKTTLVMKLRNMLNNINIKTAGFITEEVKDCRTRLGFDVITTNGTRGRLARDQKLVTPPTKYCVGKYCVFVSEFEKVALPSLELIDNNEGCLIIDEIGKMEFFSSLFKAKIKELFDDKTNKVILATIPLRKSDNLIEFIRNHKSANVWTVTRSNRNELQEDIFKLIQLTLNKKKSL